ncbi:MAG: TIM barrel protein [Planctomycetes bacterium]|nr:TIM barrel protein [Planctomycetota bacterium]
MSADAAKQSQADNALALGRRELLTYGAVFGPALLAGGWSSGLMAAAGKTATKSKPAAKGKRYEMKKSINLWAFPYPDRMSLKECFQLARDAGFDAVEVNYDLEGDLSPEVSEADLKAVGRMARQIGLEISGVCSFLFWPYSLTSNDEKKRRRGLELAAKMIDAARCLGTPNLLVVPGAVYIPWIPEEEPVPNDVCEERARQAIQSLLPHAKRAGVSLNIENIFANGFLLSPSELVAFVDAFESPHVNIHFDTGNIMQFQFPEHWIRLCGRRIRNVHLKEYDKRAGTELKLESFRPLLDGTTDWPAVLDALQAAGYRGYLTFEYFHPYRHWPETLIYHTSDALDRMLGRKA